MSENLEKLKQLTAKLITLDIEKLGISEKKHLAISKEIDLSAIEGSIVLYGLEYTP